MVPLALNFSLACSLCFLNKKLFFFGLRTIIQLMITEIMIHLKYYKGEIYACDKAHVCLISVRSFFTRILVGGEELF